MNLRGETGTSLGGREEGSDRQRRDRKREEERGVKKNGQVTVKKPPPRPTPDSTGADLSRADQPEPGLEHCTALAVFTCACEELQTALDASGNEDAKGRLSALHWSLGEAPEVGVSFMECVGEQMQAGGRMLAPDLVEDALLSYDLTKSCAYQSRFSRESVLRYLHASGDLLAQVVNSARSCGIAEGNCALGKVLRRVTGSPDGATLARELGRFKDSEEFKYVAAATNRMKHRSFLPGSITASLNEDWSSVSVAQVTGGFTHDQGGYSASSLEELCGRTDVLRGLATRVLVEVMTLGVQTGVKPVS